MMSIEKRLPCRPGSQLRQERQNYWLNCRVLLCGYWNYGERVTIAAAWRNNRTQFVVSQRKQIQHFCFDSRFDWVTVVGFGMVPLPGKSRVRELSCWKCISWSTYLESKQSLIAIKMSVCWERNQFSELTTRLYFWFIQNYWRIMRMF